MTSIFDAGLGGNIHLPPTQLWINNTWTPGTGELLRDIYPATGQPIADISTASAADVDRAVAAARAAFESSPWPDSTPQQRGDILRRLADLIERHSDRIARLETIDTGKPFWEASQVDLPNVLRVLRFYAGAAQALEGETLPVGRDTLAMTLREPLGVCGIIVPWNFPLLMAIWKIAPALAAGNTVVLKPAELTPLTALALAELAAEAGLPPGVLNIINGVGAIAGNAMAHHPDIDKIGFTGSTAVGKSIMKASAETNLKKLTLELGGKSPVVVFPDADLEFAIDETFDGIYFNQGEVCSAGSRVIVHRDVKDAFVDGLRQRILKRKLGDPFAADTQQGAMISEGQLRRVAHYVRCAQSEGARLVAGGHAVGDQGYFHEPTLLDNVAPGTTLAREEVFGPVLAVQEFGGDMNDAIRRANDSEFGLAAVIFTRDMGRALHVARRLKAGVVWANCSQKFDPVAPFGGYKQSGFGRDLGRHALDEYSQIKTLWLSCVPR